MGDFRFRSLLFQELEARTSPVQSFSLRKGASEPARIMVPIPLMEFQNLHSVSHH